MFGEKLRLIRLHRLAAAEAEALTHLYAEPAATARLLATNEEATGSGSGSSGSGSSGSGSTGDMTGSGSSGSGGDEEEMAGEVVVTSGGESGGDEEEMTGESDPTGEPGAAEAGEMSGEE